MNSTAGTPPPAKAWVITGPTSGIGRRTAEAIVAALATAPDRAPAVNVTTGEVLDDPVRQDEV